MAASAKKAVQRKKRPYKRKQKGGTDDATEREAEKARLNEILAKIAAVIADRAFQNQQNAQTLDQRDEINKERKIRKDFILEQIKQNKLDQKLLETKTNLEFQEIITEFLKQKNLRDEIGRNQNIKSKLIDEEKLLELLQREKQLQNQYNSWKRVPQTASTFTNFIRVIWNALKQIGNVIAIIGKQIKDFLSAIKELLSRSKFASYIAIACAIIVLLFGLGFLIFTVRKRSKPSPAPAPAAEQKPTLTEEEEGKGFTRKMPELPDPPALSRFIPSGISTGLGGFFDRIFPTYKARLAAESVAGTLQSNIPPQETTKRERIIGRCDNIRLKETSLNSGGGGVCTSEEVPTPIRWVVDSAKIPDYNMLPDPLKQRVTNNGVKNIITIPWKSDGFVYSPDCARATYGGGSNLANLLSDYNTEFCQKREVDKTKYDEAYRIKKQMDYYKGIDVFE